MSDQRVLVLPENSGITYASRRALKEAGIVVVVVKAPHLVRYLSSEPFPATASELLRAAVAGLNHPSNSALGRARAWDTLAKILSKSEEAPK